MPFFPICIIICGVVVITSVNKNLNNSNKSVKTKTLVIKCIEGLAQIDIGFSLSYNL